jgi:hypothetical protein
VSEEAEDERFLVDVPDDDALVVGGWDDGLPACWEQYPSNPVLVSAEGAFAVAGGDVREFDGFVSRAGEEGVSLWVEGEVEDVVVMSEESFAAEVMLWGFQSLTVRSEE